MTISVNAGDRIILRDRPWRVLKVLSAADDRRIVECTALDGDDPHNLSAVIPPEEAALLPNQDVQFDLRGIDSSSAWFRSHLILGATLIRETGLLTGARFGRVALEAYQLAPALRILAKPRPSLLIADDVGLGKTIEAGLAILELMARARASRILVITPPGLMDQWQQELLDKFGLKFSLIDNASGLARAQTDLPAGISPWDAIPRIITSIDFIKKETIRNRALRKQWDLVIVDEAHALAESGTPENPYRTQRTRLGLALRNAARGLLLLTATPHNGYAHSFRSLLELIEPTLATFAGKDIDRVRRIEATRIRRMKSQIKRRNSDGSMANLFPQRSVSGLPVTATTEEEKNLLRKIASYCSRTARAAEGTEDADLVGFAMQIVKKRALSSRAAFAKTLDHRLEALRKEEAQEEAPDKAELRDLQADLPLGEATAERTIRRVLRSAIPSDEKRRKNEARALNVIRRALAKLPEKDPKTEALLSEFRSACAANASEKIIVFTEYRDTLDAIQSRLDAEPEFSGSYVTLHGGLSRTQRLKRQEAFEKPGIRLLLATDAASEGLNLQKHCCRIFHFELPWNPNRLEQRNGRVDRYGQTRNPVIRYLYYPDSPEETVLSQLVDKIERMAEDRVSTPDILGVLAGESGIARGLTELDPEADDVAKQTESLVRLFEDRTAEFIRGLQPLLVCGPEEDREQENVLALLETDAALIADDAELERIVLETLGSGASAESVEKGIYRLEIPWNYRGPGVKALYPAATFRRSIAIRYKPDEVEYLTPLHPLIMALAADARRRLLQAYPSVRGLPPRRLAACRVGQSESPSILFTFHAAVSGGNGLLEERILSIKVDLEGRVRGNPEESLNFMNAFAFPGEVSGDVVQNLFAGNFDKLRAIAAREAQSWIESRAVSLRKRRSGQARMLLRDLEIDTTDRLREIDEEEKRSTGLIDATGQQRLFAAQDSKRSFESRRAAVRSYAEKRRQEIAEFERVEMPDRPSSLGALFLAPEGGGL